MTISAFAAAREVCQATGWATSNLALQKILYIAQMMHLGEQDQLL